MRGKDLLKKHLPSDVYEKFKSNNKKIGHGQLDKPFAIPSIIVSGCFTWDESPEGMEYWQHWDVEYRKSLTLAGDNV